MSVTRTIEAFIHPQAEVAADAVIGDGSRVWEHARLREGVRIGRECIIGRGAYLDAGVVIGDRVKIQNNALVYHGVFVASGVFIGPGAILTNDRRPRSITPTGGLATPDEWTVSPIHLAEGCSIGAGAVVVAGVDVGPYAMVGAGSVVTRAVAAHAVVVGNPARVIGWVCRCGDRLSHASGSPVSARYLGPARCRRDDVPYLIDDAGCRQEV
jgi:acetyltransferase-like isoleucine patch superfamily enzyme